ncbi:MAG: hypothetical protein P4L57_13355 [Rhizomicrobium sp.]|nr:hypothetical protein [Rhizomicrobium sp.]
MASWVRCVEYEVGVVPSFCAQLLVNLDTVRFMVRGVDSTRITFIGSDHESAIEVHESPEQILGVAPK